MRLAKPIYKSGRNVTADNRFTSLKLVRDLEKEKLSYVGTIRQNRRELPQDFISPKNMVCFNSIFGYTKNETLVSYCPKKGKTVTLLSSLHVGSNELFNELVKKPEVILFYNDTKSRVDVVDKLCGTYHVGRTTRRWPMVIFYHLMNTAGINARVILLGNNKIFYQRRDFLKKLSLKLGEEQLKCRAQIINLPKELKILLKRYKPVLEEQPSETRKRLRCERCYEQQKKKSLRVHRCELCGTSLCLRIHAKFICEKCLQSHKSDTD
ncbi:piggyBac transposable element-derived protein 4-like [Onthophagus taurus]|uniref:piggyBac transposable element-derived protein 4-like n=1 Tax=Onthophagus taurus TaxID=166361 RepID=UPI0039BEC841